MQVQNIRTGKIRFIRCLGSDLTKDNDEANVDKNK